jgi:rhamnogalacturonan endolyase
MTSHGVIVEGLEPRQLLAFGVTTTTGGAASYVVDNGGDLKFTVLRNGATTSSTVHLGDITSIKYKGQEMLATYAQTSRHSHYEQGLGSTSQITYSTANVNGTDVIVVKCDDSAATSGAVIHYYVVRRNDNNIYMASLPIDVNNGPGEGRYIAYLSTSVFPNPEAPSDNRGNTGSIEGSDVFGHADGTTTSKFYNMGRRMIENEYHGVTGTNVGTWMFMGNREHSAGGPFFKDIDFQTGSAIEIYNCIFTGHTQTEDYRQGLHVYALQFNDGSTPVEPDYSFMESLNIQGWIAASQRGALTGTVSGIPAGREATVALANSAAQYWTAMTGSGPYTISGIRPGTYTETLYLDELAVGTRTVTISAGQTTAADITNTYFTPNALWRIGTWDGTPKGFLNADKIEIMHPSDVRMSNWTSTPNFVVGTNTDAQWPMVQFMGVNNSQRITFNLTSVQALTLRIGITLGFEGGRNRVTVNSGQSYAWTSSIPAASRDLNSRGITRGTWRGDNQLYTYNIPTSALRVGTNTIDLPVVSGSYVAGQTWLSPNVAYDAIDLVPTSTLTNAPKLTSITVTPANPTLSPSATQKFTAIANDQFGNGMPANVTWSTTLGTIDDTGIFVAPTTAGGGTVTATSGTVSGSTTVNVTNGSGPTVATPAAATPNPADATSEFDLYMVRHRHPAGSGHVLRQRH